MPLFLSVIILNNSGKRFTIQRKVEICAIFKVNCITKTQENSEFFEKIGEDTS